MVQTSCHKCNTNFVDVPYQDIGSALLCVCGQCRTVQRLDAVEKRLDAIEGKESGPLWVGYLGDGLHVVRSGTDDGLRQAQIVMLTTWKNSRRFYSPFSDDFRLLDGAGVTIARLARVASVTEFIIKKEARNGCT